MSVVTDVVVFHSLHERSIGEDAKYPIHEQLNKFFNPEDRDGRRGFVSCDDASVPRGWYGGTKMLQSVVLVGAFNYLDLEGLIAHIGNLPRRYPKAVIVIAQREGNGLPEVFAVDPVLESWGIFTRIT